jgi:hypothetical protein
MTRKRGRRKERSISNKQDEDDEMKIAFCERGRVELRHTNLLRLVAKDNCRTESRWRENDYFRISLGIGREVLSFIFKR